MHSLFRSRRRSMIVSWLSVLVMLTSVLGWLPAAAEDATPVPTPTSELTNNPQSITSQVDSATSTQSQELGTIDEPIDIMSVSVACSDDASGVTGSFSVANPRDGAAVELRLVAGDTVLRTDTVALNADVTTFAFEFALEPADSAAGDSVLVTAREDGGDATAVSSDALDISRTAAGDTACGVAAAPTSTATATATMVPTGTGQNSEINVASPTPTGTAAVTPTVTPTASPTVSPTPDDEVVERLVAELVRILDEVLNAPTPTEPPDQSGGDPEPTNPPDTGGEKRTAMVSGTGGAGLRCRTAPVDGRVITVLPEGAQVQTRGDTQNGWVPVRCDGQDGWSSATYLIFGGGGGSGELWIDIDLGSQYMRVYRGDTVIRGTYVSTGRPGFDTPTGTYQILVKYRSDDMEGVLGGEYYFVPNVPWTMYFTNRGHAIHGAYWHNNFGHVMSHGCVNAPVPFAEWLYSITPLGTRVVIHY